MHTYIHSRPFGASFCLTCAKYLRILRDPFLNNPTFFDFSFLLLLEAREYKNAPCASKGALARHKLRYHASLSPSNEDKFHPCLICEGSFRQVRYLLQHYIEKHKRTLEIEERSFASRDEFLQWKEKEESATGTHFVKPRGRNSHGLSTYVCNRSGTSRSKTIEPVTSSVKLGTTCNVQRTVMWA